MSDDLIWPNGTKDDVIPFEEAAAFIGEPMTVEGIVRRTHNSGNAVFLNFTPDIQPDAFHVVIFPEDWDKFPRPPEILFDGKRIRVEGVIQEYRGAPQIIVESPWQTEIALTLGQSIPTTCDCQPVVVTATPAAEALLPPTVEADIAAPTATIEPAAMTETTETTQAAAPPLISWEEAAAYEGQTVIVAGQVVDTYNSGKVVFLNFDEDFRSTFKVVIFPDAWPLFPAPPEDLYRAKTVHVTGPIIIYEGAPEIIVDQPEQITIVE